MPLSEIYNTDCLAAMREMPDNAFELAIVDPPYGIGEDGKKNHSRGGVCRPKLYSIKRWDSRPPDSDYFAELFRVSRNSIIFGANHFIQNIPNANSSSWIVWDKQNTGSDFADCELAWTNYKCAVRKFEFKWSGMLQGDMKNKEIRIHPTQKPIALYKWLLKNYAKPGDRIIDTHLGSGSSRIAAHDMGFDFVGYELDAEYFEASDRRFKNHISNLQMFAPEEMYQPEQAKMF